ncbi:MAG: LexA family transcriptional regulator [Minwuia sp.]|nr:LexA family transcriptional regulator [Minwuia sp.]
MPDRTRPEQNVTTNRIREWRKRRGMTQGDLAERLDTSINTVSQLESGNRQLSESWMRRLGVALDVAPGELTIDGLAAPLRRWVGQRAMPVRTPRPATDPVAPAAPPPVAAASGLPLFTTQPRGDGAGTLGIFWGQAMEHIARPPGLAGADSAYCLYMQGDRMTPRFEHGERIYVSPTRPARLGDDVVVYLNDRPDAEVSEQDPVTAFVGRMTADGPDSVTVSHFRPPVDHVVARDRIAAINRIYPTAELLGV